MTKGLCKSLSILHLAGIVAIRKLIAIPVKMVNRNLKVDTNETSFQERPKTLNGVGVNIPVSILPLVVIYALVLSEMLVHTVVGNPFVGHDSRISVDMGFHHTLECASIDPINGGSNDNLVIAVKHTQHSGLVNPTSPEMHSLAQMLIPVFAANESFIDLDNTIQRLVVPVCKDVSNSVKHEPSSFLSDTNVSTQLHGRDALLVGRDQVESKEPLLQWEGRVLEDRTNANRERLTAISTLHQPATLEDVDFPKASTMRADRFLAPPQFSKVLVARVLCREV